MNKFSITTLSISMLCSAVLFFSQTLSAADNSSKSAEQRGLEIFKKADQISSGFHDSQSKMKMVLINRQGKSTSRELRNKTLEGIQDGDKSIIIFDSPGDVKNTVFLSHTHKTKDDDQWLFLPALKRVKRISSSNKSGPFMGSEFSFEDLSSPEIEKFTYKYLKNEKFSDRDNFVVERKPVDKKSGYSKQIVWIDSEHYRVAKIDFYDRKKSLLKTLVNSQYKQYLNRFWRPNKMVMNNHQNKKKTEMYYSNIKFNTGLSDKDFTKNALKKSR